MNGERQPRRGAGTVLVVDDSESVRTILAAVIENGGWQVVEATGGEAALALLEQGGIDLVVLDAMMPGLSGYQVCEEMRRRGDQTPVIFLSALSDPADRVAGLQSGAVDFVSKPFDPLEISARIATQLRLRRLASDLEQTNRLLSERQEALEQSLRAAAAVQRGLLPREDATLPGLAVAWRFVPCEALGGDLLHFHQVDGSRSLLWVIDVSGHGAPAALLAATVWQALAPGGEVLRGAPSPAAALGRLDRLFPVERFERHFTIALLSFDDATGELACSGAGHPPPLLLRRDGNDATTAGLGSGGPLVGLGAGLVFDEERVRLGDGDRVLVVSDGILEAIDADGEPYGATRLASLLRRTRGLPVAAACDAMLEDAMAFRDGRPFDDDATMLLVERTRPDATTPAGDDTLRVRIDGEIGNVRLAASALRGWCAPRLADARDLARLETAVAEALNNAVLHGEPGADVTLVAAVHGDDVVAEVSGTGPAFEPGREPGTGPAPGREPDDREPDDREPEDDGHEREGGRGWAILRGCVDEVTLRREDGRNTVTLRLRPGAHPRAIG